VRVSDAFVHYLGTELPLLTVNYFFFFYWFACFSSFFSFYLHNNLFIFGEIMHTVKRKNG